MRRPLALSLIVLGLVVTLIGGTGLFAPFTDTATTGTNSLTSGSQPKAADIQIVWPSAGFDPCAVPANYSENSTSPGLDVADIQPGFSNNVGFCVKNVGTGTTGINVGVIDRVDVETDCTGDESAAGDLTCGNAGVGELSTVIFAQIARYNCTTGTHVVTINLGLLSTDPNGSAAAWALAPGEIWCGIASALYQTDTALVDVLKAQSDRVTWAYQFVATVP